MKNTILHHSDKWFGVFTDTPTDPEPPKDTVPPPAPEFGTEPPVNTDFGRVAALNI